MAPRGVSGVCGREVWSRPVAMLVVLRAVWERLARGSGAVLARGVGALRAGVQRGGALVGPLLAIVGLAGMAGGAAWAAPGGRATAAVAA
jgi:hypothetical protein